MLYGYVRVSTDHQAEGNSPAEQIRQLNALAMFRDEPIRILDADIGTSGSVPLAKRNDGARLLERLTPGDVVAVTRLDRMCRSMLDALNVVEEFKRREVGLIILQLGQMPIGSSAMTEFFYHTLAMMAQFERRLIIERTSEGKGIKRAAGGYLGGSPPYGFRVEGKGRSAMLVPDPKEQATLDSIMFYHDKGFSTRDIAKVLDRQSMLNRVGKRFDPKTISVLIKHRSKPDDGVCVLQGGGAGHLPA